jgi:hypothetical protein
MKKLTILFLLLSTFSFNMAALAVHGPASIPSFCVYNNAGPSIHGATMVVFGMRYGVGQSKAISLWNGLSEVPITIELDDWHSTVYKTTVLAHDQDAVIANSYNVKIEPGNGPLYCGR